MQSSKKELQNLAANNGFELYIEKAEDGVEEIRISVDEPKLSLDSLHGNFETRIDEFSITAGHGSLRLVKEISKLTGIQLLNPGLSHYANQASQVDLEESVRGTRVIVVGSICRSICDDPTQKKEYFSGSDNYEQLRDIIQSISLCWGRYMIISSPYVDFAKQDVMTGRQHLPWAKFAGDLEAYSKIRGFITMFPHCEQTRNAFRNISVDFIPIQPFALRIIKLILQRDCIPSDKICLGAFDAGSVKRLASLAEGTGIDLFINYKRKASPQDIKSDGCEGNPSGYTVFSIDDFQHSAGTLNNGITIAVREGAEQFYAFCGHIDSVEKVTKDMTIHADDLVLGQSRIKKFIFSDSTPLAWELRRKAVERGLQDKIMVLKASEILSHVLLRCIIEIPATGFMKWKL